jgi:type VI secretion system protein ImpF
MATEYKRRRQGAGREPAPVQGLRTPLFDRLQESGDDTPAHGDSGRVLERNALMQSVRAETAAILNTRTHLRGVKAALAAGTVLDYGLPDFSSLSAASIPDLNELSELMARKIAAGDPRLTNVRVLLRADKANPKAVTGAIFASLRFGTEMEPVTFPLQVDSRKGVVIQDAVDV